jgi:hypothetical protein
VERNGPICLLGFITRHAKDVHVCEGWRHNVCCRRIFRRVIWLLLSRLPTQGHRHFEEGILPSSLQNSSVDDRPPGNADPEVRVRFPSLPDSLRSSGSGTGSTQVH